MGVNLNPQGTPHFKIRSISKRLSSATLEARETAGLEACAADLGSLPPILFGLH
jgi:hypothetical protein